MLSPSSLVPSRAAVRKLLACEWATLVYLLLSTALLTWISWDAYGPRLVTFGPGSDIWEHTATLRALIDDPLHPRNPHLVSTASSPRFTPHYLLIALVSRLFGMRDALDASGIAALANTALFLGGLYAFFRTYFTDARAPLYALIVSLCGWWDAWSFSNVYQLSVFFSVASYPSTAALGVSFFGLAAVCHCLRLPEPRRGWLVAVVGIFAYLLLAHPLTAVFGVGAAVLLCLFHPDVTPKQRLVIVAAVVTGAAISHLWPYFSPFKVMLGGDAPEAQWIERTVDRAAQGSIPRRLHQFYDRRGLIRALGIALAGIPLALGLFFSRRHRFMAVGAVGLVTAFALNVFVRIPLGHRIVLLAIPFLHMTVVWALLKLTPGFKEGTWLRLDTWPRRIAASLVIAALLAPFAHNAFERAQNRFQSLPKRYRSPKSGVYPPSPVVKLARAVAEKAGPDAVVLADVGRSWSLPTFGPRVVALLHKNPLVPDNVARMSAVSAALAGGTTDAKREAILKRYSVTHVMMKGRTPTQLRKFLEKSGTRISLPDGYELYALTQGDRMGEP